MYCVDIRTNRANRWSNIYLNFYALPNDMAEPINAPPTPPQPSTSHAAEVVAAGDITPRRSDDKYAPTLFYGRSIDDAETYIGYIERYKA